MQLYALFCLFLSAPCVPLQPECSYKQAYGLCPRGKIRQTLGGLGFVLRIINQQIHYGLRTHAMKYQHKKVPRRVFFSSQRCYSVCVCVSSSCICFLGRPTAMAVVATKSRLEAMSRAVLLFSISQALLSQTCRSLGLEEMPLSWLQCIHCVAVTFSHASI